MQTTKKTPHIVIVGGGFAGIEVAKTLIRKNADVKITIVSKNKNFEYYPALYKLVIGTLPIEVSVPLHVIFKKSVEIVEATYTGLVQERQVIKLENGKEIAYDFLVLALGSETNYFNIKGLSDLSFSFKSVKEALRLKQYFCDLFSRSKNLTREELVSMLHILIVGGGPSGVELAGDLRHYLTSLAVKSAVDPSLVTIDLIEASNRVLQTLPQKVSNSAEARLREMGVNIFVNRAVQGQDIEEVVLKDMKMGSQTVIWTAGTRINTAFTEIPGVVFDERKRIKVSPYLSLPNDNRIFIAGDGAGTPYSGLAQTAIHNGKYIGKQIANIIAGKETEIYKPKKPSFVVPIGDYWALFSSGNFLMKGFLPWLLRSAIDFRYFTSIVPLHYVLKVFRQGRKYRKVHGGCEVTPTL
jgi:NADH dehydrogenase